MKTTTTIKTLGALLLLNSCSGVPKNLAVVSTSGTTIGLNVEQAVTTGTPAFKFGYNRAELALVDKTILNDGSSGEDVPNVLMELNYRSMTNGGGGIYQRLAVGKTAVSQKGAAVMFAKDEDGKMNLTKENVSALNAVQSGESPEGGGLGEVEGQ